MLDGKIQHDLTDLTLSWSVMKKVDQSQMRVFKYILEIRTKKRFDQKAYKKGTKIRTKSKRNRNEGINNDIQKNCRN